MNQAEEMENHPHLAPIWRAVALCLRDCAKELESMSGPQGSRKTSVDDDRARSPMMHHDVI
jgi:hypothetical protein